jgi:uncharacterized protein YlxW (UPF0749 family)
VPLVALMAGLLFATSASAARGTDLRAGAVSDLGTLVEQNSARIHAQQSQLSALQASVNHGTANVARADADVAAAEQRAAPLLDPAGLVAEGGPGLEVQLNDAPDLASAGNDADLNALVVHQSDVQAVVNALWTGGAEAMSIMDHRIINTSAVRCVGNTLLLDGQVYSPPFIIKAIGPASRMRTALNRSPGVLLFAQAAKYLGLGYTVTADSALTIPAYTGVIGLTYAKELPQ